MSGPAVIGYDGSPSAKRAVHAASILVSTKVLIVAVWEPGLALDLMTPSIEPVPIDLKEAPCPVVVARVEANHANA